MNPREIRRIIRKLSKRRHSETMYLVYLLPLPHSNKDKIKETKERISDLTSELNTLLGRL